MLASRPSLSVIKIRTIDPAWVDDELTVIAPPIKGLQSKNKLTQISANFSQPLLSLNCDGAIDGRKERVSVAASDVESPVSSPLQNGTVLHHHGHTDPKVTKSGAIVVDSERCFAPSLSSHVALVRVAPDVEAAKEGLRRLQASSDQPF